MQYPLEKGESWWVVHPNTPHTEFKVPAGGVTVCIEDFMGFSKNIVYTILGDDPHNGWITVQSSYEVVEMPYYVFARYFDAQAFIRGVLNDPIELEGAEPFDYRPTLPKRPDNQMKLFSREYDVFEDVYTGDLPSSKLPKTICNDATNNDTLLQSQISSQTCTHKNK